MHIINVYVKFHPLIDPKDKKFDVPFLVNYDGMPLEGVSAITKILNKIFQKKVGCSMLRHMYLSEKYGKVSADMANDAKAMSHSLSMQKTISKNNFFNVYIFYYIINYIYIMSFSEALSNGKILARYCHLFQGQRVHRG